MRTSTSLVLAAAIALGACGRNTAATTRASRAPRACLAACAVIARAGCDEGRADGCAEDLARREGAGELRCATVANVTSKEGARAAGAPCD